MKVEIVYDPSKAPLAARLGAAPSAPTGPKVASAYVFLLSSFPSFPRLSTTTHTLSFPVTQHRRRRRRIGSSTSQPHHRRRTWRTRRRTCTSCSPEAQGYAREPRCRNERLASFRLVGCCCSRRDDCLSSRRYVLSRRGRSPPSLASADALRRLRRCSVSVSRASKEGVGSRG